MGLNAIAYEMHIQLFKCNSDYPPLLFLNLNAHLFAIVAPEERVANFFYHKSDADGGERSQQQTNQAIPRLVFRLRFACWERNFIF